VSTKVTPVARFAGTVDVDPRHLAIVPREEIRFSDKHRQDRGLRLALELLPQPNHSQKPQ